MTQQGPRKSDTEIAALHWWRIMSDDQLAADHFDGFAQWMDQDPAHKEAFDQISSRHHRTNKNTQASQTSVRASRQTTSRFGWAKVCFGGGAAVAAMALVFLTIATFMPSSPAWQDMTLPDGSVAQFAPGSTFEVAYSDKQRTVHLSNGSVIIDAAKDRVHPLRVVTDLGIVSVVGTRFAVSVMQTSMETSVQEGVVRVDAEISGAKYVLKPGDRLWTGNADGQIRREALPPQHALELREGWQTFWHASVSDVLDALSRHSGQQFIVLPTDHTNALVSGRFQLTAADQTLSALKMVSGLHVRRVTGVVSVIY